MSDGTTQRRDITYIRKGHVDEVKSTLKAARDVSPPSTRGPHGRQQDHVLTKESHTQIVRVRGNSIFISHSISLTPPLI